METAKRLTEFFDQAEAEEVLSAYLFGSHSSGTNHAESDIDVAVLVDREARPTRVDRDRLRIDLGSALISTLGVNRIDVVSLEDVPPELGRRIVTEGLRVYCASPEADHTFVRDVQLRAADLDPFLRRMRALKLEALSP